MFVLYSLLFIVSTVYGFCGDNIKWSHNFNIEDVYGMWYGVGYAQHTPDMTNKPNEVGCVTVFIIDVTAEKHDDWLDWSIIKRNYTDQNWRSDKSNPWSNTAMAGSWLNVRVKRSNYNERKLRIIWDEDGESMEQIYTYTPSDPGLWVANQKRPLEEEMQARGIQVWYPDDPPRHPQVIRIIKLTPNTLILNHCSEMGDRGVFSLIFRRSPSRMQRWEWYDIKTLFFNFELPNMHRYFAICAACDVKSSVIILTIGLLIKQLL